MNRRFGRMCRFHLQGKRINSSKETCWTLSVVTSSTLKMEATRSSETFVYIKPTKCNIPKDDILHSHRCENLK
jgi:hypothetical protein